MKLNARFQAPTAVSRNPVIEISDGELRTAIKRNEFVLHYQPQINIANGLVVGLEAFVRWNHPQRGLMFPDSFLGGLKDLGIVEAFGWLIVERGMAETRKLSCTYQAMPRLTLKMHAAPFSNSRFPELFISLTKKYDLPCHRVAVEVSGSGSLDQKNSISDVLTRLRIKGVQVIVDDYGSGGIGIQDLRQMSATELKIDRKFVQNMLASEPDRTIVRKLILIAHELNMKAVAEGVETEQQLEFLCHAGCDYAQGFYFSHPLCPEGIAAWLKLTNSSGSCCGASGRDCRGL